MVYRGGIGEVAELASGCETVGSIGRLAGGLKVQRDGREVRGGRGGPGDFRGKAAAGQSQQPVQEPKKQQGQAEGT